MRPRPVLALAALACAALAAPARADDGAGAPDVVVLADGQTVEGRVAVLSTGEVEVSVDTSDGGTFRLVLDPTAVERIERAGQTPEERLPRAAVTLVDGRELEGEVRVRGAEVRVAGPFGEVRVAREDVARITPVVPEAARVILDGDLGLVLPLPQAWVADAAEGLGERLRAVRRDGRARLSALLRAAPPGDDPAERRVRAALAHDLGSDARLVRRDDGRFAVRDRVVDPAVPGQLVTVIGVAELEASGRVLWVRALLDGGGDEALEAEVEGLVARRAWLAPGVSRDGAFFRDPALGLLVEAPPGYEVRAASGLDRVASVSTPRDPSARLDVHVVDDDDPRAALQDLLAGEGGAGGPAVTLEDLGDGARGVRARGERVRGVAVPAPGGRTAVVVARAGSVERLAELTGGVALIDVAAPDAALAAVEQLLPQRALAARLLEEGDRAGAERALELVFAEAPQDPEALSLKVACARAGDDAAALRAALDAAWVAGGAPWVGEALGRALLEDARALGEAPATLEAALEAIERAAEVWPAPEVDEAAARMLVAAARRSFEEGADTQAWARLARARALLGPRDDVDAAERDLRLRSAKAALQRGDTLTVRRDARRAYALGADGAAVETLYRRAEEADVRRENAEAAARRAARARAGGGGGEFSFGVPPTRTGRANRVRPTAFTRPTPATSRVRAGFATDQRQSRVRPRPPPAPTRVRPPRYSGSRRVRTNGQLVFSG